MVTCAEMIRRLQALNLPEEGRQSIVETKHHLIELNQQQMDQGIRADGEPIHWLADTHYPYSPAYARYKAKKGGETRFVNLKLSEAGFRKTEVVDVSGEEIQFRSTIRLSEYLEQNYSNKIFGITNENKALYTRSYFFPALQKRIQQQTGLGFSKG